ELEADAARVVKTVERTGLTGRVRARFAVQGGPWRRERGEDERHLWRVRRVGGNAGVAAVAGAAVVPVSLRRRRSDARREQDGPMGRRLHVVDEHVAGVRRAWYARTRVLRRVARLARTSGRSSEERHADERPT